MRAGWKKLAERGDGKLHTVEQVRDAVPIALGDDWRAERCNEFLELVKDVLLGNGQHTLFKLTTTETVSAINKLPGSGFPMRRILTDTLTQAIEDGYAGERALVKGVSDALSIRCSAGARQVEEHFLRVSSERRAMDVRARIEEGASRCGFDVIARQFCKLERAQPAYKYDGLDEGVPIR
jgi:hypothetical protein